MTLPLARAARPVSRTRPPIRKAAAARRTLTITVNGTNDAPVSTAIANQSSSDGQTISLNVVEQLQRPRHRDVLAFTASGLPSGLSINSSTGIIIGTIDNNASVLVRFSVTITATDPHGLTTSRTLTWTVSNPAPTANPDSAATTENANTSGNVLTTTRSGQRYAVCCFSQRRHHQRRRCIGGHCSRWFERRDVCHQQRRLVHVQSGHGFNDLAAGETRTTSVTYTATDSQGRHVSSTLTVTVTGTNDAPTSTAISNQTNADGASVTLKWRAISATSIPRTR